MVKVTDWKARMIKIVSGRGAMTLGVALFSLVYLAIYLFAFVNDYTIKYLEINRVTRYSSEEYLWVLALEWLLLNLYFLSYMLTAMPLLRILRGAYGARAGCQWAAFVMSLFPPFSLGGICAANWKMKAYFSAILNGIGLIAFLGIFFVTNNSYWAVIAFLLWLSSIAFLKPSQMGRMPFYTWLPALMMVAVIAAIPLRIAYLDRQYDQLRLEYAEKYGTPLNQEQYTTMVKAFQVPITDPLVGDFESITKLIYDSGYYRIDFYTVDNAKGAVKTIGARWAAVPPEQKEMLHRLVDAGMIVLPTAITEKNREREGEIIRNARLKYLDIYSVLLQELGASAEFGDWALFDKTMKRMNQCIANAHCDIADDSLPYTLSNSESMRNEVLAAVLSFLPDEKLDYEKYHNAHSDFETICVFAFRNVFSNVEKDYSLDYFEKRNGTRKLLWCRWGNRDIHKLLFAEARRSNIQEIHQFADLLEKNPSDLEIYAFAKKVAGDPLLFREKNAFWNLIKFAPFSWVKYNLYTVQCRRIHNELLRTAFALEKFRRKYGKIPFSLDDLVPEFLGALPQTPDGAQKVRMELKGTALGNQIILRLGSRGERYHRFITIEPDWRSYSPKKSAP